MICYVNDHASNLIRYSTLDLCIPLFPPYSLSSFAFLSSSLSQSLHTSRPGSSEGKKRKKATIYSRSFNLRGILSFFVCPPSKGQCAFSYFYFSLFISPPYREISWLLFPAVVEMWVRSPSNRPQWFCQSPFY